MTREATPIDLSTMPDLARLAREVARDGMPRVLRDDDGAEVAVISPATPRHRRLASSVAVRRTTRRRAQPLTTDDPLFRHIGTSHADVPDVSSNKHRHLADAYETKGRGRTP